MKTVAKALLIDSDEKILVLRRSSTHPRFAYHLDFPGGEVEPEESAPEAVAREISEESGLQISSSSLQLVYQGRRQPGGTVYIIFAGQLAERQPKITLSWEHDAYEWLNTQELLSKPVPPGVDSFYETALHYLRSMPDAKAKHSSTFLS